MSSSLSWRTFVLCTVCALFVIPNSVLTEVINTGGERINLRAHRAEGVWTAISANLSNNDPISVPASVPGGIYSDLDAAGIFSTAIYYRYNDLETRWVGRTNWTFTRSFNVSSTFLEKQKAVLVCDGLDTIANVFINGILVGSSENMFVRYIYDVKSALKVGNNVIRVDFQSPVEYARKEFVEQAKDYPILPEKLVPEYQGENHANLIRKMQASFSWDWGPSYPSSGIWKNIYLQSYDDAVIRDVLIFLDTNQVIPDETEKTTWTVTARVYTEITETMKKVFEKDVKQEYSIGFEVSLPSGVKKVEQKFARNSKGYSDLDLSLTGAEVKVWYPNGYGEQPLYSARGYITTSTGIISSHSFRIGFRTVELNEEQMNSTDPELGNHFYVKVNGKPIYSKGSNSIPLHVLPERVTKEQTEWLFKSAKATHMNMIRVWGGGIYESDLFFDLADETGVMIWEDFMFACAMYPANDKFLNTVRDEVDTQVKRLQYHAGLAIWATNNENEAALRGNWYGTESNFSTYKKDYVKLYIETIKTLVEELDPSRQCLPSSPTNGRESGREGWVAQLPYDNRYGDVHFYNYRSDSWDYRTFPKTRYASEYGYQSWPSPETFEISTSRDEDWYWDSDMMYHRQHHPFGQEEIPNLITHNLPLPTAYNTPQQFLNLLELNRIQQAMAYRTETESYRRLSGPLNLETGEGKNMGALYWQLNDIWPGASWASVEYNGRWKLNHYYARDFYSPNLISLYKTYDANEKETGVAVNFISDSPKPFSGYVRIRVFRLDRNDPLIDTITSVQQQTTPESRDIFHLNKVDLGDCANPLPNTICLVHTSCENTPDNFLFLQYPNKAQYVQDPGLKVTKWSAAPDNKTFTVTLETNKIALFVTLNFKSVNIRGTFSDNGFVIVNRVREVTFTSETALSLTEFQNNFEIWSLYDLITTEDSSPHGLHPYWKNVILGLRLAV